MTTKRLINNIEVLSTTLTEKQLIQFLDIMDDMTVMMDMAKQVKKESAFEFQFATETKYLH